ncbi:MAG: DUF2794 domain-containing protein [Henriciella sp.]|nr:hypothetical protein [Hyphomonadaceae bacterium]OUX94557.1 MAG: hypothetical protein CBB77_05615 [Hyphomonas sp. TMED17]CAI8340828.1 MAG: Uncharacterised protein [Hyphomonas sp. TMED17]
MSADNITRIQPQRASSKIAFQRPEMSLILNVYGRLVMAGEAKDYAVGMHRDQAVFAIFKRHAESPTWRIVKTPALARAQGAYAIIGSQGQTLKRGKDLMAALSVFDTKRFTVVKS